MATNGNTKMMKTSSIYNSIITLWHIKEMGNLTGEGVCSSFADDDDDDVFRLSCANANKESIILIINPNNLPAVFGAHKGVGVGEGNNTEHTRSDLTMSLLFKDALRFEDERKTSKTRQHGN